MKRRIASAWPLVLALGCGGDDPAADGTESGTASAGDSADETAGEDSADETVGEDSADAGDGDGDSVTGDGTTGDGDGATGDGDGASGDGDGATGDGDGSSGDGDGSSGDGDGSSGDGDGSSGDGDGSSGDGDGSSGDGTSGDGDGTSGDGDGASGDGDGTSGDGTSGDGDGASGDGDGTTGDGDGTSGDGDGDGVQPCAMTQPTVSFEPPNLVMVLDKSGSMLEVIPGQGTRWDVLRQVVQTVTSSWETQIKFGAKVFPTAAACQGGTNYDCSGTPCEAVGDACEVVGGFDDALLEPALSNSANIVATLPQSAQLDPGCWTPTDFGYLRSYEALTTLVPPGSEPSALMLVIDGLLSDGISDTNLLCRGPQTEGMPPGTLGDSSQARLTGAISAALAAGIPTYVVAIDAAGAGTQADANMYAQLGGRPNPDPTLDYYPGDDLGQLQTAMTSIAAEVATCDIDLLVEPPNPDLIEVRVDGTEYFQVTGTECMAGMDGWYYSVPFTQMTLCGAACDAFKALATPTAQVDYFCTAG